MARRRRQFFGGEDPFATGIAQGGALVGQFLDPLMAAQGQAAQIRYQQDINEENRRRYEESLRIREADIARGERVREEQLGIRGRERLQNRQDAWDVAKRSFTAQLSAPRRELDPNTGKPVTIPGLVGQELTDAINATFPPESRPTAAGAPVPTPTVEFTGAAAGPGTRPILGSRALRGLERALLPTPPVPPTPPRRGYLELPPEEAARQFYEEAIAPIGRGTAIAGQAIGEAAGAAGRRFIEQPLGRTLGDIGRGIFPTALTEPLGRRIAGAVPGVQTTPEEIEAAGLRQELRRSDVLLRQADELLGEEEPQALLPRRRGRRVARRRRLPAGVSFEGLV